MQASGTQTTVYNRVAWACTYLFQAGLLEKPKRGIYVISDEGRRVLNDPPDRFDTDFLDQYPGMQDFRSRTRTTEASENDLPDEPEAKRPSAAADAPSQEVMESASGPVTRDARVNDPAQQDVLRSRAINLFTFLLEVVQARTKIVRSLESYTSVVWFSEVPREPECDCVAWVIPEEGQATEAPPWLRVRRPKLTPPPTVHADVLPWVKPAELTNSSLDAPSLFERVLASEVVDSGRDDGEEDEDEPVNEGDEVQKKAGAANNPEDEEPSFVELANHPEVTARWREYLEQQWIPWAEWDRRKRQVQNIYTKLYSLYQQQKQLGETSELVLGLGHLRWISPSDQDVNRHLISAQVNLEFDAARGEITVEPAADGARPRLEQDMLEPAERIETDLQKVLERDIASLDEDLWHNEPLLASLRSYAHSLGERGNGTFADRLERVAKAEGHPVFTWHRPWCCDRGLSGVCYRCMSRFWRT